MELDISEDEWVRIRKFLDILKVYRTFLLRPKSELLTYLLLIRSRIPPSTLSLPTSIRLCTTPSRPSSIFFVNGRNYWRTRSMPHSAPLSATVSARRKNITNVLASRKRTLLLWVRITLTTSSPLVANKLIQRLNRVLSFGISRRTGRRKIMRQLRSFFAIL